jgi:hypothetical protein
LWRLFFFSQGNDCVVTLGYKRQRLRRYFQTRRNPWFKKEKKLMRVTSQSVKLLQGWRAGAQDCAHEV